MRTTVDPAVTPDKAEIGTAPTTQPTNPPSSPDALVLSARGMNTAAEIGQITQHGFAELAMLHSETAAAVQTEIFGLVAEAFANGDPIARMALPQRCADAAMRHWMAHAERSGRMGQDILSRAVATAFAPQDKT